MVFSGGHRAALGLRMKLVWVSADEAGGAERTDSTAGSAQRYLELIDCTCIQMYVDNEDRNCKNYEGMTAGGQPNRVFERV